MWEEIDIEEHDVMDNPVIKRIFPDLSVIKKEILQYEEGVGNMPKPIPEAPTPPLNIAPESPCVPTNLSTNSDSEDTQESFNNDRYLQGNIIILGSKPNIPHQQNEKGSCVPKVVLKDVIYFLNKSKTYCKDCSILFPKRKNLKDHMQNAHGPTKCSFNKSKVVKNSVSIKIYKCDICSSVLSSRTNLIRHLKNIHKHIPITVHRTRQKSKVCRDTSSNCDISHSSDKDTGCFHCHKLFSTKKALIDHLYDVLQPRTAQHNNGAINFSFQDSYEQQETSVHNENCSTKMFECCKCAIKFLSEDKLHQHNQDKHKDTRPMRTDHILNKLVFSSGEAAEDTTSEDEPVISPKRLRRTVAKNNGLETVKKLDNLEYRNVAPNKDKLTNSSLENVNCSEDNVESQNKMFLEENNESDDTECTISDKRAVIMSDKTKLVEKVYQCLICSHYVMTFRNYKRHMIRKHKIIEIPKLKKVLFDSQCKFCPSKLVNMVSYNNHLLRFHEDMINLTQNRKLHVEKSQLQVNTEEVTKNKGQNSYAFKSVLYKCTKCDIHFLTAKSAVNHLEHMEVLINWKCCICNRIFKKIDKFMHVKQHSQSHSFTVYNLCESAMSQVLYICPKCTIHYSEDMFLQHYQMCDNQIPDSVYCKICDNLINRNDFDSHNEIHGKNEHLMTFEFTVVETDMIINGDTNPNITELEKDPVQSDQINLKSIIHDKSRFHVTFCQMCQSFITNLGVTRKVHVEGRCKQIITHVCKECGLVFTHNTLKTHKKHHREVKGLSIQNFFFYDLNFKKQICPPLPIYPNCNICGIHFLSRNDVIEHECNGYDYVVCHICQIKLTDKAFKLHIQYHEYKVEKSKNILSVEGIATKTNDIEQDRSISSKELDSLNGDYYMYSCKICEITFDVYDCVVKHCQHHCDPKKVPVAIKTCQHCGLNFDERYHELHEQMHLHKKYEVQSIKMFNFDPIYFGFDNNTWIQHIFGFLSADQIKNILRDSIYQFESRFKMEIIQPGLPNRTLYKCEKCQTFIDPAFLCVHAENLECRKMRKHPCFTCGLSFDNMKYKINHEQNHIHTNMSLKSYRIVLTNKKSDEIFHNIIFKSRERFILYQCRNCDAVVDGIQRFNHDCNIHNTVKCSHCNLIFHKDEFDIHLNRHTGLHKFDTDHINIVLFGKKVYQGNLKVVSSFKGKIHDYTFRKCKTCEICIPTNNSTVKHKCVFDDSKSKCPKCGLYFLNQELSSHALLHVIDTEFEDYNLNIITFDTNIEKDIKNVVENKENSSLQNVKVSNNNNDHGQSAEESLDKFVKIYKCECGLHFIDDVTARRHYNDCNPNKKVSKQLCSKCELLFTPAELFTHLLAHHGDKKLKFKFTISPLPKDDKRTIIFRCFKCSLHFVHKSEATEHLDKCDASRVVGEKCKKCGLIFKISSMFKNKHKKVCERKYEVQDVSDFKNNESS